MSEVEAHDPATDADSDPVVDAPVAPVIDTSGIVASLEALIHECGQAVSDAVTSDEQVIRQSAVALRTKLEALVHAHAVVSGADAGLVTSSDSK